MIARLLRKENLPLQRLLSHEGLQAVAEDLHLTDVSALYAAVGEGHIGAANVVKRIIDLQGGEEGTAEDLAEAVVLPREAGRRVPARGDAGVVVHGVSDVLVKLARCCTPVPGDEIRGFVTAGSGVSVHRADCPNMVSLAGQPERLVDVDWAPTSRSIFLVAIEVAALDRARLLSDITRVLSDQHVNILSATLQTGRDRVARSRFTFELGDPSHLGHVLRAVRGVDGVFDVYRVHQ
jgi:GTP pyrophosphokinase